MRRRGKKKNKREIRPIRIRPRGSIYLAIFVNFHPFVPKKKLDKNFNHYLAFPERVLYIYIYMVILLYSMIDDET